MFLQVLILISRNVLNWKEIHVFDYVIPLINKSIYDSEIFLQVYVLISRNVIIWKKKESYDFDKKKYTQSIK